MRDYIVYFKERDGQPPAQRTVRAISPQQALYRFAYGYGYKAAYKLWDRVRNAPKNDRLRITQIIPQRDLFIHD